MLNVKVTKEVETSAGGNHIVYTMYPKVVSSVFLPLGSPNWCPSEHLETEIKQSLSKQLTNELLHQLEVPTPKEIAELKYKILTLHPRVFENEVFKFLDRLNSLYDSQNYVEKN